MIKEGILLQEINSEQLFTKLNEIKSWISEQVFQQEKMTTNNELWTTEEVAKYFKKHKDTIENWSKKKYLTKWVIGGAVYYKRFEVESAVIPLL